MHVCVYGRFCGKKRRVVGGLSFNYAYRVLNVWLTHPVHTAGGTQPRNQRNVTLPYARGWASRVWKTGWKTGRQFSLIMCILCGQRTRDPKAKKSFSLQGNEVCLLEEDAFSSRTVRRGEHISTLGRTHTESEKFDRGRVEGFFLYMCLFVLVLSSSLRQRHKTVNVQERAPHCINAF